MSERHRLPCERCGVQTSAQFCRDCHLVDPQMCADGRTAREQQKYLVARSRHHDGYEFSSWALHYITPSSGKRPSRARDLSSPRQGPAKG